MEQKDTQYARESQIRKIQFLVKNDMISIKINQKFIKTVKYYEALRRAGSHPG